MRKIIRIVIIVLAGVFLFDGIVGLLDIQGPFIDFYREFFPRLFGR